MNKKQRIKNRENAKMLKKLQPRALCPNCGEPGPHFVPPHDFGPFGKSDEGFFMCDKSLIRETLNDKAQDIDR